MPCETDDGHFIMFANHILVIFWTVQSGDTISMGIIRHLYVFACSYKIYFFRFLKSSPLFSTCITMKHKFIVAPRTLDYMSNTNLVIANLFK